MREKDSISEIFKKIQALKYKYALLPLSLVIMSYFLSYKLPRQSVQILSIIGLVLYLLTLYKFRLGRSSYASNSDNIISPISGKVKFVEEDESLVKIVIYKNFLDVCVIRFSFENDFWENDLLRNSKTNIQCEFSSKKIIKNVINQSLQGEIAGFNLSKMTCTVSLPKDKIKLEVKEGDKCIAGKTTLGIYNEN
jgi:hypothetical protein